MTTAEPDAVDVPEEIGHGEYLPGTSIEVRNRSVRRGALTSALFDFDGTLSLIREGWQQVMVPMMVELLAETPSGRHAGEASLARLVRDFVDRLTGKQTIYQMIRLAEEVRRRGAEPLPPLEYKRRYHDRLWQRIRGRVAALASGQLEPDSMLVPGARELLRALRGRGVALYLASGTDVDYVRDEAAALRIDGFFDPARGGGGMYGALDDYERFSKAMVIQQILGEHHIAGEGLVVFGDGYVEIQNGKEVGGLAVGVASDEARREGVDEWKRRRLIAAGADVVVPDFLEHERLLAWLFAEELETADERR